MKQEQPNIVFNKDGQVELSAQSTDAPLNPENAVALQHQEWLRHPVTQQMFSILEEYGQHMIGKITHASFDSSKDAEYLRNLSCSLSTCTTIHTILLNTTEFVNKLKEN